MSVFANNISISISMADIIHAKCVHVFSMDDDVHAKYMYALSMDDIVHA